MFLLHNMRQVFKTVDLPILMKTAGTTKSANHRKQITAHIALPWTEAGNNSLNSTQVRVPKPKAYAASYSNRFITAIILNVGTNGDSFSRSSSGEINDKGVGNMG